MAQAKVLRFALFDTAVRVILNSRFLPYGTPPFVKLCSPNRISSSVTTITVEARVP